MRATYYTTPLSPHNYLQSVPAFESDVATNSREDLSRPQPIRYPAVEKDTRFETRQQSKQVVADSVGGGFKFHTER